MITKLKKYKKPYFIEGEKKESRRKKREQNSQLKTKK
jgi:hypothetical protein